MLCDQIIAWPKQQPMPSPMAHTYQTLGSVLQRTPRFVLNRDAVMTVHSIGESTPKRFLQALNLCRLPYPSIWVEFSYQDRADWMADAVKRGLAVQSNQNAGPPSRLGFYMEQQDDEGRIIQVVPCWSHSKAQSLQDRESVSIGAMALIIDTHDGEFTLDPLRREALADSNSARQKQPVYGEWMTDPEEIEAGFALEARMKEAVPDILMGLWSAAIDLGPEAMRQFRDLALFDLLSEWRFVLALLTVLNSRNVIEVGPVNDMAKLNKARAKKGAPPLLTHREIKLNPSRVQKRRLAGAYRANDLQRHIVRGHWKLRSSGLFWWNPFVRGRHGDAPVTTTVVRG